MEKIIHKYLTSTFDIDIEETTILEEGDIIYYVDLIEEIYLFFGINGDEAEDFLENWILSIEPNFNVEEYILKHQWPSVLPIASRVAAQTLGSDLVSVQPRSAPSGELLAFDFVYNPSSRYENQNGRTYSREAFEREYNNQFGELDHPQNNEIEERINHYIYNDTEINRNDIIDRWMPIISGTTML